MTDDPERTMSGDEVPIAAGQRWAIKKPWRGEDRVLVVESLDGYEVVCRIEGDPSMRSYIGEGGLRARYELVAERCPIGPLGLHTWNHDDTECIWCGPNALAWKPGEWVARGEGRFAWKAVLTDV